MSKSIFHFQISSEEDLRFQLDFVGLVLTGRALKVSVRERASNALKIDLTAPSNLTLAGSGNLTVFYPRASMTGWAKGIEYEADIIDETGGSATRIMAVRFIYDHPGNLIYGVKGNQASVTWGNNQATVTAIGGVGPPGPANVITIGDVDTLETGEPATATLTGDAPTQVLNLGLPKGDMGTAAAIAVGDVTTVAPGSPAAVTNSGTSSAAVFDFDIPAGAAATIAAGDVTTIAAGEPAAVTNSGTSAAAVFDFDIPAGAAATITIGDVTASLPGSPAVVTNVGTDTAAVFDFEIPRGEQGPPGSVADGDKGDVVVSGGGTVWTVGSKAVDFSKMQDIATAHLLGRITAGTGAIEALTKAQAQGALDITALLIAIGALAGAANKLPYLTGVSSAALTDLSAFARSLLDDADAAAFLATLGITDRLLPAGITATFAMATPPAGWLEENGAAVAIATYGALDTAIYCGGGNNATAAWGYRCTNPANPTGSRSTSGTHIVLRDRRGEFERGWDNSRGIDSGRTLWSTQNGTRIPTYSTDGAGALLVAKGSPITESDGTVGGAVTRSIITLTDNSTITQYQVVRSRNVAGLPCIKY